MRRLITTIALLLLFPLFGQNKQFKKIDSIINSQVQEDHPGIAVGIIKDGKIVYERYRGLSNLQHQIPFDEKTRSNIASTAKQFTALMILKLSLEEKLKLEDDIRDYLPNVYKHVQKTIRIRNLLNHTSGIRDYVELMSLQGSVWWKRFGLDNNDILKLLEKQEDLGFEPGSMKNYSNSNYNLLAEIIERVSGKSFNEYSKEFFKDLRMNETSFVERYMRIIPNRANPYSDWGRGEWWEVPTVTKTNGEGFLYTTLRDQLIFEKAVQNASFNNNILLMKSQKPIPYSTYKTYGFGLELYDKLGHTSVHHSGGTFGFHSQVYRFPEEKLTIFIMSNNGNISSNLIAQRIGKILLPKSIKKAKYDKKFYTTTSITDSEELGQYRSPIGRMTRIVKEDGKFYYRQNKYLKLEMIPEGNHKYHFSYDPSEKIGFYKDEMILFDSSGEVSVFDRISVPDASLADLEGYLGSYFNKEINVSFELIKTKDNELKLKFAGDDELTNIQIFNRNEMLAGESYGLKIIRDTFDRVTDILFDYARAMNIKFQKKTNLKFQPKIPTEGGSIQVSTIGSKRGKGSTILLTKNKPNGNEIWHKRFGGSSYDKASSIIETEDGYLIVGSTSSYGVGNYDMFVIKTDKNGEKLWQNTYGKFDNDYGYTAEKIENGFIIKGTIQQCNSKDVLNRKCSINVWFVTIDEEGNKISDNILEEVKS